MKDQFDLKKFLTENKTIENSNPFLKEAKEEKKLSKKEEKSLEKISKQLKKSVKAHGVQAKTIDKALKEEEMSDTDEKEIRKDVDAVRDDLDQISKLAKDAGEDAEDIKDMVDEAEIEEAELPTVALKGLNREVKDVKSMAQAMLDIFTQVNDTEQLDYSNNATFKLILAKLNTLAKTETPELETK